MHPIHIYEPPFSPFTMYVCDEQSLSDSFQKEAGAHTTP